MLGMRVRQMRAIQAREGAIDTMRTQADTLREEYQMRFSRAVFILADIEAPALRQAQKARRLAAEDLSM